MVRAPDSIPGEDVADIKRPAQEARFIERRKRNPGVQKGGHACSGPRTGTRVADTGLLAKIIAALKLKRCEGVSLTVGICDPAPAGYPTEYTTNRDLSRPWPPTPGRTEIRAGGIALSGTGRS